MSAQAQVCSQCRAPLPAEAGMVECRFCGAATLVQPPVGTAQIRAVVKRVLAEDGAAQGEPATTTPPARNQVLLVAVLLGVMALAAALAFLLTAPTAPTRVQPVPVVVVPPVVAPPPKVPNPPLPVVQAGPFGVGVPDSIALGEGTALYLVSGGALVKADRESLRSVWSTPLFEPGVSRMRSAGWAVGSIVAAAGNVAFAGPLGVSFFDAETGAPKGKFLLRHDGFKVSACAAGGSDVLVQTVFDGTLRFDLRTGKRSTGSSGCVLKDTLRCDQGQRCGWTHGPLGTMECRYGLFLGNHTITFCEEDGTKALCLVDHEGAKIRWKVPRGEGSSTNPSYASVVDGVLITADHGHLEAFDPATGARRWGREYSGHEAAVVSDGHRLFVGAGDTVVVVEAKTGADAGRVRSAD